METSRWTSSNYSDAASSKLYSGFIPDFGKTISKTLTALCPEGGAGEGSRCHARLFHQVVHVTVYHSSEYAASISDSFCTS
jgi:hypothetical protein